jgi:hypothetical protein
MDNRSHDETEFDLGSHPVTLLRFLQLENEGDVRAPNCAPALSPNIGRRVDGCTAHGS